MLPKSTRDYLDQIFFSKSGKQGSYSSLKNLLLAARKERPGTSASEVKAYLQTVPSYVRHRRILRRFPRRKLLTFKPFDIFQADIIYLKSLTQIKSKRSRNAFALTCIDPFNRVAHAHLMQRKTPAEALKAFQQILADYGGKPAKLHLDEGTEFLGSFKAWCAKEGISIFHTKTGLKAFLAEGLNRDLKLIIARMKSHEESQDASKFLSRAVEIYNNSSSSGLPHSWAPNEAKKADNHSELQLWHLQKNAAYAKKIKKKQPVSRFLVGQKVRVLEKATAFTRGFAPRFKKEHFTILAIAPTTPRSYAISNAKSARFFYEQELAPIFEREEVVEAKIEKILSERTQNASSLRSGASHRKGDRQFLCSIVGVPQNKYLTEAEVLAYSNGQQKLNDFLAL